MTTSNQPPKNEGLLTFLSAILKKSSETPQEIGLLATAVSMLSEQLTQVVRSVEAIITAIDNQNKAISDLYTVQEYMLKQMKPDLGLDASLPAVKKPKPDKPN